MRPHRAFLTRVVCSWALVGGALVGGAHGDERLAGVACRSVHLWYSAEAGRAFYNEVTITNSAPGSYFMVCGWNKGYFGLQELGNGKKLLLFSVWDSGQNDPGAVAEEERVRLVAKDAKVRIGRFGGEGTGGQAFFDFDWKPDQTYRLIVSSQPRGERTEFTGWFFQPEEKAWKKLVTFSAPVKSQELRGYYSFVEDFHRNKVSAARQRQCSFGNGWVAGTDGKWQPLVKARFTADRNPATNIDAGSQQGRYFLATGGQTQPKNTKLGSTIELPSGEKRSPPRDLPKLPATVDAVRTEKR